MESFKVFFLSGVAFAFRKEAVEHQFDSNIFYIFQLLENIKQCLDSFYGENL